MLHFYIGTGVPGSVTFRCLSGSHYRIYDAVSSIPHMRYVALLIALTVIYFAAAKLGLTFAFYQDSASPIWPASGIALFVLLWFGYRLWPGVFLGAFLANVTNNDHVLVAVAIAIGNTLEALIGAYLIIRFADGRNALLSIKNVFNFVFTGVFPAAALSATIGVLGITLGGLSPWGEYDTLWLTWWLGDVGGVLFLTPLLLAWWNTVAFQYTRRDVLEFGIAGIILAGAVYLLFGPHALAALNYPIAIIVIPFVLWFAIRYTFREATVVTAAVWIVGLFATLSNYGPFAGEQWNDNQSLIFLTLFLIGLSFTSMVLTAAVAERKRVEDALGEAHHVKDEFLAVISHELRNPLSSVLSYLELMRLRLSREADNPYATEMKSITSELSHVTRLLEDLLDISRVARGKIQLHKEQVTVQSVVSLAESSVRPFVEEHKHTLSIEMPSWPIMMDADPDRIRQSLVNLLRNAVKYTDPGGTIWVTAKQQDGEVTITVKDTGVGIEADKLPHIFDMFSQIERSTTRSLGGLGIGLTLVKRIVELHGGKVTAKSEGLGKGSEFSITLPGSVIEKTLTQEELQPEIPFTPTPPEVSRPSNGKKVLVVDDNKSLADSTAELLRHFGYEVEVSYTGDDALSRVAHMRPHVVLLDIRMPSPGGYEIARRLREKYKELSQPLLLIAISGYGNKEGIDRALKAGFDHYFVKPVDILELQRFLREWKW